MKGWDCYFSVQKNLTVLYSLATLSVFVPQANNNDILEMKQEKYTRNINHIDLSLRNSTVSLSTTIMQITIEDDNLNCKAVQYERLCFLGRN